LENIVCIINGCINKEHKYQKILYEQFRGFALKTVFRYIYRYEKAIDVVNDSFVKLFNHLPQFEVGKEAECLKRFMGWLKKILINTCIDELRKGDMLPEIGGIPDYVWEKEDGPQADQVALYNDLIALVKALPPMYRTVFNLYVIDGYTHTEIANLLKISVGTSKSTLSRARAILQNSIQKSEAKQYAQPR